MHIRFEQTSSVLPGMLLVWMNVDAAHDDDFNRWYDREHLEERVRIPGFLSGTRYQCTEGSRRYLCLYRTASLAVFETAAYHKAFQHQTPWSVANLALMQDAMRRVCSIDAETGAGTGAWLAVLRLGTRVIGTDHSEVATLGAKLLTIDGVVSSRLLVPNARLSTPLPAEDLHGRVLDPIFLIEASSEAAAANAGRHVSKEIGAASDNLSVLQLMWQLRETDLSD